MSDDLKTILYGKTATVKLADGKEYILREPCIDALETLNFDATNPNDVKSIKSVAYALLKEDNPGLDEKKLGKLITISMMQEGSELMNGIQSVLNFSQKKN